jgi:hypothetical protein
MMHILAFALCEFVALAIVMSVGYSKGRKARRHFEAREWDFHKAEANYSGYEIEPDWDTIPREPVYDPETGQWLGYVAYDAVSGQSRLYGTGEDSVRGKFFKV